MNINIPIQYFPSIPAKLKEAQANSVEYQAHAYRSNYSLSEIYFANNLFALATSNLYPPNSPRLELVSEERSRSYVQGFLKPTLLFKSILIRPPAELSVEERNRNQILSLEEQEIVEVMSNDFDRGAINSFINNMHESPSSKIVLGAYRMPEKALLGAIFLQNYHPCLRISYLEVNESEGSQGVGTLLMNSARCIANMKEFTRIETQPTSQSLGFYFRLGFIPIDVLEDEEDPINFWRSMDLTEQIDYANGGETDEEENEGVLYEDLRLDLADIQVQNLWQDKVETLLLKERSLLD